MPFISSERVKEIRNKIKKKFPDFKFSVTRQHGTKVNIGILEGPASFVEDIQGFGGYAQINHYYIQENHSGNKMRMEVLSTIKDIATEGQEIITNDADYGNIPNYYISISIGKWDRLYKVRQEKI